MSAASSAPHRESLPVILVGAGIGGLTAAIALHRAGIACQVVEKVPQIRPLGAGLALQINALRALARLELAEPVRLASGLLQQATIRTARGRVLQAQDFAAIGARYGQASVAIHRARLHQVLLDAARDVPIETGVNCLRFDDCDHGVVLQRAEGPPLMGAALIGADGLRSFVRQQLWGEEPLRYSGYTSWRGICANAELVTPGEANESWGPGRRFGYVPIGDNQVYWFATQTCPPHQRDSADIVGDLQRLFGDWHRPIPGILAQSSPDQILRTDIFDRPPRTPWGRGRVTLLGDAAHPMTPNLGQGACQAIEDAVALADAAVRHRGDWPAALRDYEQRRGARTARIVKASWQFGRLAQGDTPSARFFRDRVVPLLAPLMTGRQLRWLFDGDEQPS
ncbi:MAG: FAD-dependent monooxygenase [Pirellulales bacterium]|nr:FAD-dependent monooxygenase [Pirellulales bacterium]